MSRSSSGEGMAAISLAKAGFLVTRTIYFLVLPHLLSGPAEYGNLMLVLGSVMVLCAGLNDATVQGVSKIVAENPGRSAEVRSAALIVSSWIGLSLGALLAALAPALADLFGGEKALVGLFRLGGLTIGAHLLFAVYLGLSAGEGRFRAQAALDLFVSVAKLLLVLGLAAWAGTALSALAGFTLAQYLGVALAAWALGLLPWKGGYSKRAFWQNQGGLLAFALVLNLAVRSDLFLLKALAPPGESAVLAGYYGAAQVFASVPNALVVSVNLVLLPLVAATRAAGEEARAKSQIRGGLLLALIALCWISVAISANSRQWLALVYPAEYGAAAPALEVLVFGGAAYTIFLICSTLLAALAGARIGIALASFYLVSIYTLGAAVIGNHPLLGAAWTHTASGAALAAAGLLVLGRFLGAAMPARGLAVLAAAGAAYFCVLPLPGGLGGGPWALLGALGLRTLAQSALFLGLCWAGGVFASPDLKEVLGHRQRAVS